VVEDAEGGLWLFFSRGSPGRLFCARFAPASGTWSPARQLTFPASTDSDTNPVALQAPDHRSTWLFWVRQPATGLAYGYYRQLILSL
jgi:hypothetical protein